MYKKILSFLLIFCMLCGMMPMSAFAAEPGNEEEDVRETVVDDTVQQDASQGDVSQGDVVKEDVSQGDASQGDVSQNAVGDMPDSSVVILVTEDSDNVFEYSLKDGYATITKYQGNASTLNIPDTLDGYTVVGIGASVFKDNSQLRVVVIPDSVTEIKSSAFRNCINLSSVKLSKNLQSIAGGAFYNCDLLTEIEIPKSLEIAGSSNNGAFNSCDGLINVNFEQGVTRIASYLFDSCPGLKQIEIPNTVTEIQNYAFNKCKNLKEVTIPDSVTKIGNSAFNSCTELKEIAIPNNVTEIGSSAFENCTGFKEVVIPDSVTEIGSAAFSDCTYLSSVKLSKSLKSIGLKAFSECDLLTEIEIPKSLEKTTVDLYGNGGVFYDCDGLKNVSFEQGTTRIASHLFEHCPGLEQIEIPDTVTEIQNQAFKNCTNLKEVTIPINVIIIGSQAFDGCIALEEIVIPDSVTEIGSSAFSNCTYLSSVKLSKSLKSIGLKAFYECDLLTEIEIPKSLEKTTVDLYGNGGVFYDCDGLKNVSFEQGTIRIVSHLFEHCPGLEQIEIPNTVTEIQNQAFKNCTNLKEVTIPDSVITIKNEAFTKCIAIEEIVIPDSVTELGTSAFENCAELKEIVIPDSVTKMGTYMFASCAKLEKAVLCKNYVTIPTGTFDDCSSLKDIELPDSVTTIQDYAFRNCSSLETFTIDENSVLQKIGNQAFRGCKVLTGIVLPDRVTSLGTYVFAECDSLTDVTLGTGITTIPTYAFNLCAALEKIVIPYRVTTIQKNAFTNCTKLTEVSIPRATTSIADGVFSYPTKMTIYGVSGTYAETYAGKIGANFVGREIPVTAMEFTEKEIKLPKGTSKDLILKITPMDFTDTITWRSSDTSIVTVTDGKVKAVAAGTAQITALAGDSGAVRAVCEVEVVQPVTSISLNKTTLTLEGGETFELVATVNPDTAYDKSIEWSSSDEDVATVTQDGVVTAIQKGSATITVTALDGTNVTKTCKVTVNSTAHLVESVEEMQSEHPYANNINEVWIYTLTGAERIKVIFSSDTEVDDGYDFIYIYDGSNKEIGKYTGTKLAGETVTIEGDTVRIRLVSDDAITAYGFQVTSIIPEGQQSGGDQPGGQPGDQPDDPDTVSAPTASVSSGDVELGTKVKLTTKTEGASIYYTLDGTDPTTASNIYRTAIAVNEDITIKAFAVKAGFKDSAVATFRYTVAEKGSLWGDVDPEDIPAGGIPEGMWIAGVEDVTYTGKAIKQDIRVYDYKTLLVEKKDYTVSYKNNTNAADKNATKAPSIIVTGKGNYGSKTTVTFSILPVDISKKNPAVVADDLTAAYTGKKQQPVPVVTVDGKKLANKKNYTLQYPSSQEGAYVQTGTYEIRIIGTGNYSGERTISFTITNATPMSKVKVTSIKTQTYTGEEIKPVLTVKNGKQTLAEGTDYRLTYENNVEIGTAYAVLEGIGDYSGIRRVSFKIAGQPISKARVTNLNAMTYNGEEQIQNPSLTIMLNGTDTPLKENRDYTVTYQKNTNAGTATVIFTGINGYSGTLKKTFKINAYDLKNDSGNRFKIESGMTIAYAKGGAAPKPVVTFEGDVLTEGKDYTLKYSNNKKIASAADAKAPTITVTGKGNFKGSKPVSFSIVKQDISHLTLDAADKVYQDKANIYSTKVAVIDTDGKKLAAKTDYEAAITYTYADRTTVKDASGTEVVRAAGETVDAADIIPVGTVINVKVRANENGSYTGELTGSYRFVNVDISKAKVTVKPQAYTGEAVKPGKDQITVTLQGQNLPNDAYEIVSYSNNVKKGKATIVIRGVGNYGGTKSVKFNIQSKVIGFLWW